MTTQKLAQGARNQLAGAAAALSGLASATYVALGTITHNSAGMAPLDTQVELSVTPGTVASLKQVSLFAQISLDGTTWSTGPSSGTASADEPDLYFVGVLPLNTNATLQRRTFSLAAALPGGVLPFATRLIAKNETGSALAASGHDCYTQDITGDSR